MQSEQFQLHAQIEAEHWWFVGRRRVLRHLVELLLPSPGATIVDVGCGTGANIAALADRYRATGIDTSAEAIELARSQYPDVEFLRGRAPDDFRDLFAAADLVLLMDVLEHVSDDVGLLASLIDSLRPGAQILITVPADPSLWSPHDLSFGHYRRYDAARLSRLWAELPVAPRLLSCFNARLYPIVKLVRTISRLRGLPAGDAGTDFHRLPKAIDRALARILAGEARPLGKLLTGRSQRGYRRGVSLLAVLARDDVPVVPSAAPQGIIAVPPLDIGPLPTPMDDATC